MQEINFSKIWIFFLFVVNVRAAVNQTKPYRLSVLQTLQFTGYEPRDGQLCKASATMVADIANSRRDILPDYHVEWDFQDEGANSIQAVRLGMEYLRRMENPPPGVYQSPFWIGSFLTPGCKAWGPVPQHVNMVMLAGSCTGPSQTARRNIYPNMYRPRAPAELHIIARVFYLLKETKLRKLAILFNIVNAYNYETANVFYDFASRNGVEIQAFEVISIDFNDEIIFSLKKRDVRVFAIEAAEGAVGLKFLCQAYKYGITGPRYVFIFQLVGYVNIFSMGYKIFPDCTRDVILEQWKYTMFVGAAIEGLMPTTGRTSMGQTAGEYEEMFDLYTNKSRTADYDFRHLCYDRAQAVVIMLNNTEAKLSAMNMSLRDYRKYPDIVMKVANESAAKVDFESVRYGRFSYSARGEFDTEPLMVTVPRLDRAGLNVIHRIRCQPHGSAVDLLSYVLEPINPNLTLKFPKDSPIYKTEFVDIPISVFGIVVGLSGTLAFGQLGIGVTAILNHRYDAFIISKMFLLLGCLVLDAAAISFAITNSLKTDAACILQIVFLACGVAIVHGILASRLMVAYKKLKTVMSELHTPRSQGEHRLQTTTTTTTALTVSHIPVKARRRSSTLPVNTNESVQGLVRGRSMDRAVFLPALAFFTANATVFISWLATDTPHSVNGLLTPEPLYDFATDTYSYMWSVVCRPAADDFTTWAGALIGINAVPLLFSIFSALKFQNTHAAAAQVSANVETADAKLYVIAATILSTLYVCTIAIAFVASSSVMQVLTTAFASLLYSASSSVIIFFDVLKRNVTKLTGDRARDNAESRLAGSHPPTQNTRIH